MELGDPPLPLRRRRRRRHDGAGGHRDAAHRPGRGQPELLLAADAVARLHAAQRRHGCVVPRPHAQTVRLADLHDVPDHLADVLGFMGAAPRLRSAARLRPHPAARRLAVARSARAETAATLGGDHRPPGTHDGAGLDEHRARRRDRHLHGDPAQHHGRAPAVEQRDPRPAVPVLGAVGRRGDDAHRVGLAAWRSAGAAGNDRGCDRRDDPAARAEAAGAEHRQRADPRRRVLPDGRVDPPRPPPRQPADVVGLAHRGGGADHRRPYAIYFWGVIVAAGVLLPIALQGLELSHRIPHTVVPALLVLVGGYTLRWVMVNAGQASQVVHAGF
ncbi:MAG: polysulfide reductase NrfD [Betaproteobacteria bacterium]|nr:polysulfide reductase NrfD [Betaproteobacteria bacterium]